MQQLEKIPDFNYHIKCEKLKITSLSFADYLPLFPRGDKRSIEIMISKFNNFSRYTWLKVNPRKFHIYFGAVDENTKEDIKQFTSQFLDAMLPLPKAVIHKNNAVCRRCLWTGGKEVNIKFPIAWKKVNLMKLMWNMSKKTNNLWIKCIHTYYIKGDNVMNIPAKESHSWLLKHILKQRTLYQQIQTHFQLGEELFMKDVYFAMQNVEPKVSWRNLFYNNLARPRAQFVLWLQGAEKNLDGSSLWIPIRHNPMEWKEELNWFIQRFKSKGWRSKNLKCVATKTIYSIWRYRNDSVYGKDVSSTKIEGQIIDTIVYRGWTNKNFSNHITTLMIRWLLGVFPLVGVFGCF
ncbi:uncharacterized protein LOC131659102 [Vicia villosa]|uniref:uncharacterized protein LOC131659102 n=1 Tax=Vicia villosa TaxID=3911 RepID=UPI00273CD1BE|nr:uncharacterized protein LOC131659102 [Vicia villosa]